jgi:hypothetical protein
LTAVQALLVNTWPHRTLGKAVLVFLSACACTPPPLPVPLTLAPSDRATLATSLEGRWITGVLNGDTVTVTTELKLERGVASEVQRTSPMGGESTVRPTAEGHYTVTESGTLALSLTSNTGERRLQSTVSFARGWPGSQKEDGVALFVGAYVPRTPAGRAFRYEDATWSAGSQPPGIRRAVVDIDFSTPLRTIVASGGRCIVGMSVYAQLASETATERHTMQCHAVSPNAEGLVEIVIDDFRRIVNGGTSELPFVSDLRKRQGKSELADLLERAVDRSFYVDPKRPDVLLRAVVGLGRLSAWWRMPG